LLDGMDHGWVDDLELGLAGVWEGVYLYCSVLYCSESEEDRGTRRYVLQCTCRLVVSVHGCVSEARD